MTLYSKLVQKVLLAREKDETQWEHWTTPLELYPVSQSEAILDFKRRLEAIKEQNKKVIVAGDYDCDGVMATTIMVLGLRKYGIETNFYIPDRIKEGYGLSERTVKQAAHKGYDCIITVDNGVKAIPALTLALELGLEVIVTDHHTIEEDIPCDLLVHPDVLEKHFSTLCGAAVAYECIRSLGVDSSYLLELAGVASIGDVMVVKGQTRALIQKAVASLQKTHEQHIYPFLESSVCNEENIAFQIVPKINAVGRLSNLGNVNNVVRYFLSEDYQTIQAYRAQILHLNDQRKKLSQEMVSFAKSKIHEQDLVHIISDASFHEGIIGLVAGNICSQTQKATIIMSKNRDGYKASMRSPEGFNCMEFFKDYENFEHFGGHSQAAGFFVNLEDYDHFCYYVKEKARKYKWKPVIKDKIIVTEEELSIEAIESLDILRPFGPGFEKPMFQLQQPFVKRMFSFQNGKHCKYTLYSGLQCMNFNQSAQEASINTSKIVSFSGYANINSYRGRKEANLILEEIEANE